MQIFLHVNYWGEKLKKGISFRPQKILELTDALAINSTSVKLEWQLHVSSSELYIEVSFFFFWKKVVDVDLIKQIF